MNEDKLAPGKYSITWSFSIASINIYGGEVRSQNQREGSDEICFFLVSEQRKETLDPWDALHRLKELIISHQTETNSEVRWGKFGNLRKTRFSSCHCVSEFLRGALGSVYLLHISLCEFSSSSLWTEDWLGGANFPSVSPLRRNWKYVLLKLPEHFFRWKINCLAAPVCVRWVGGSLVFPCPSPSAICQRRSLGCERGEGAGIGLGWLPRPIPGQWPLRTEESRPGPAAAWAKQIGVWPSGSMGIVSAGLHFPSLKTSQDSWPRYKTKPQRFL